MFVLLFYSLTLLHSSVSDSCYFGSKPIFPSVKKPCYFIKIPVMQQNTLLSPYPPAPVFVRYYYKRKREEYAAYPIIGICLHIQKRTPFLEWSPVCYITVLIPTSISCPIWPGPLRIPCKDRHMPGKEPPHVQEYLHFRSLRAASMQEYTSVPTESGIPTVHPAHA